MQQLETQVLEAERNAYEANQQVNVLKFIFWYYLTWYDGYKIWNTELLWPGLFLHCIFQVQWMEERLKATDLESGDSELKLFRRCQDLQAALQEKEELITSLEQQVEEQVSTSSKQWGADRKFYNPEAKMTTSRPCFIPFPWWFGRERIKNVAGCFSCSVFWLRVLAWWYS